MLHPCDSCGTTVVLGGTKRDGQRYCNAKCAESGALARRAESVPPEVVEQAVRAVVAGDCPVCAGPGPVDAFVSYRVLSALVVTSWRSLPRISCRSCATKAQLGAAAYSLALGWWGFPWGLVMTPVQVVRNLIGLAQSPLPKQSSPLLVSLVQTSLAARAEQLQVEPAPALQQAA